MPKNLSVICNLTGSGKGTHANIASRSVRAEIAYTPKADTSFAVQKGLRCVIGGKAVCTFVPSDMLTHFSIIIPHNPSNVNSFLNNLRNATYNRRNLLLLFEKLLTYSKNVI